MATTPRDKAIAHYLGLGLPIEVPQALEGLAKAAREGDALAHALLSHFLQTNTGYQPTAAQKEALATAPTTPPAIPTGFERWVTVNGPAVAPRFEAIFQANYEAAQAGDPVAMYNLSAFYGLGRFVPANPVLWQYWLRRAAAAGSPQAQWALGAELLRGRVLPRDLDQGRKLVHQAADSGIPAAMELLVQAEERPPLGVISREKRLGYLRRLAQKNDGFLETWHDEATKEPVDASAAKEALELGLQRRLTFALDWRAWELRKEKKMTEALPLFEESALKGSQYACLALGDYYFEEKPGVDSFAPSLRWYTKAAELGSVRANVRIGRLYDEERWGHRDAATAFEWFEKAAREGDSFAQTSLGIRLISGNGVTADMDEAETWLRLAVSQDDDEGRSALGYVLIFHKPSSARNNEAFDVLAQALRKRNDSKTEGYFHTAVSRFNFSAQKSMEARLVELCREVGIEDSAGSLPDVLLATIEQRRLLLNSAEIRDFLSRMDKKGRPGSLANLVRLSLFDSGLPYDPVRIRQRVASLPPTAATDALRMEVESIIAEDPEVRQQALADYTALLRKNPGAPAIVLARRYWDGIGAPRNPELAFELVNLTNRAWSRPELTDQEELQAFLSLGPVPSGEVHGHADAVADAIRKGGTSEPRPFHRRTPVYPYDLKLGAVKGEADVELVIDQQGAVTEVRIVRASHPLFADSARQTALQWLFIPGIKDGVPVKSRAIARIQFQVQN